MGDGADWAREQQEEEEFQRIIARTDLTPSQILRWLFTGKEPRDEEGSE